MTFNPASNLNYFKKGFLHVAFPLAQSTLEWIGFEETLLRPATLQALITQGYIPQINMVYFFY